MIIYEPGSGLSPDTGAASILIVDFPDSSTMRNKCLLFNLPRKILAILFLYFFFKHLKMRGWGEKGVHTGKDWT